MRVVTDQCGDRVRQERLPNVCDAHDARGMVDRVAEELVVAVLDDTGVQPGAHLKRDAARRLWVRNSLLQWSRGANRIEGVLKRGMDTVASHLATSLPVAPWVRATISPSFGR